VDDLDELKKYLQDLPLLVGILDFVGLPQVRKTHFSFPEFSSQVIQTIVNLKQTGSTELVVVERAYPLNRSTQQSKIKFVSDHINLSTQNPLLGKHFFGEPRFFAVNQIYKTFPQSNFTQTVLIGLNKNAHPSTQEAVLLTQAGATNYSYNLTPCALMAAHQIMKATGVLIEI
jgi:purine nucleoside phosphorylase